MVSFPGPVALGRGVVVGPGARPPDAWADCPRVAVGPAELDAPGPVVAALHESWLARRPMVIELSADPASLRAPSRYEGPVHDLDPGFELTLERLQFLVWSNAYDARGPEPVWWHGRKAARRFGASGVTEGGPADLLVGDGTALYVDGGPPDPPALPTGTGVVHRWNAEAGALVAAGYGAPSAPLAVDQLAAVGHRGGAARVVAPAGSGKTRVLTERLRHLVADRRADPSTVTALAFNTRAAAELDERVGALVDRHGPHIRTLNSVGLWVCNEFGARGRLKVLDEAAARAVIEATFTIRRQPNTDTVAPYLDALSAIRLGLRPPETVEAAIPDAAGVAGGFDRYRRALEAAGAVDFDEQIYRAIEILAADPAARARAQATCRRLLVDELQDLAPAHLLLIRLLCAPGYDCFGVGDDDQVVYGYAGATPEHLVNFSRYFPGAGHYALEVNYRCPPALVGATRNLLSHNEDRLDKTITTPSGRTDGTPPVAGPLAGQGPVALLSAPGEELAHLAVSVVSWWLANGVPAGDVAVLARVSAALLPVQIACLEAGVPCTAPVGAQVLRRTGIRTALAYLRIGAHPDRISAGDVSETIRRPSRGIAPMVVDMLTTRPSTSVGDIRRLAGRLSGRDVPKLVTYARDLETVAAACRRSTAAALRAIRADVGLGSAMDVLDDSRREADRSTHADDLSALESVAALHPDAATFEPWLREVLSRPAPESPAVLLSTIHRVKGKEWPRVLVYGASTGLFPHRLAADEEEEERRVFHVAITRARTQVAILSDRESPSAFVAELTGSRPRPTPRAGERRRAARHQIRAPASQPPGARGGMPAKPGTPRSGRADQAARRVRRAPVVEAAEGLVAEYGGHVCTVVGLDESGAVVGIGRALIGVPYGSEVRVDGHLATLVAPPAARHPHGGRAGHAATAAADALRAWRSGAAKHGGVPAYVVLRDEELVGIAERMPTTIAELARCRGMGEIRLDRYGDEILAALGAVRCTPG